MKTVQGLLRHANVTTTLGKYAHTVNASMMAAQEAVLRAMKSGSRTVLVDDLQVILQVNSCDRESASAQVVERNGRHEETRTPDLYRVKVAL